MNIAPVNFALNAVEHTPKAGTVRSEVSLKMLDKALEANEATNDSMVRMMEMSLNPHVGGNFDMSV